MFYPKLALTNLKKNGKTYLPYLLTCVLTVMMYYVMGAISRNAGLEQMQGASYLKIILNYASGITGVFSAVFLFYTNSFLVKQRKKEFGLYQVLGMDKSNLARMMTWETILTAFISLVIGLGGGVLLGKLMFLILLKLLHFDVPLKFAIEPQAMIMTLGLFLTIFVVTLLFNLLQVQTANPIELLHGGNKGEKEPKAKWFWALIGLVALGVGYYIAQTTESPLSAIGKFFFAVVLVIIGTYCLFTAGSIALLKILKKNKKFYYKSRHFISVSGMIYRMKQNAVGLANICIMSTVVLVLVSVSVSLYVGFDEILQTRFPTDFSVTVKDTSSENLTKANQIVEEEAAKAGVEIENRSSYRMASFTSIYQAEENRYYLDEKTAGTYSANNIRVLEFMPLSDYNNLENKNDTLEKNQVLIYSKSNYESKTLQVQDEIFDVKKAFKYEKEKESGSLEMIDSLLVIIDDEQKLEDMKKQYGYPGADQITYHDNFDLGGKEDTKKAVMKSMEKRIAEEVAEAYAEYKDAYRADFYSLYGGLFFLGIFVGALFLMATVLIIYYKQISEGYDDRNRFQIMQKVGMDKKEVRRSIKSQVLMVFFLPLLAAIVHVAFAFKTVTKLLALLNLFNVHLFLMCTVVSVLIFAVFYGIVFIITSKEYYRIVQ